MLDLALQLEPSSAVLIHEESSIQKFVGRTAALRELVRQHSAWFHWISPVEFDDLPGARS